MSPLDFDRPRTGRGQRTCRLCSEPIGAHVQIAARRPRKSTSSGVDQMVASRQHAYCRKHASDLYDELFALLEGFGS